jgi:DNA-binding SARP family transcriptional activator
MAPTLNIRLLGEFSLDRAGTPVTGVSTPRLQSLLTYLLLHRDAPQSRAHLAFQFWPDSAKAQARSNLRTLLHRHAIRSLPRPPPTSLPTRPGRLCL